MNLARILCTTFVVVAMAVSSAAYAQYPAKPVRILHPFAVGGGSDLVTRVVIQKLSEQTGHSFIVENRTGAGGRIAYEAGAKAPNDGYTLVTGETTYCILAGLYGRALPWDAANDLIPITVFAQTPFVIVVNPNLGVSSLRAFIELAKSKPGKLNYGSAGIGSNNHIFGELFKREANVDIAHIPYKGMGDAITGLLSGSVDMLVVGTAPAIPHITAGRMQALALASSTRSAALPVVPTVVEAGLPNFIVGNWFGLLAPKGTPPDIVNWLHKEIVKALASPEVKQRFATLGVEPSGLAPQELGTVIRDETERWTTVIRAAGIRPE